MLSQRETRYRKQKIIGGNLLKSVYDRLKNAINRGSKILNREIKKSVMNQLIPTQVKTILNDRSRAILSNLIAGSGFKNYISKY